MSLVTIVACIVVVSIAAGGNPELAIFTALTICVGAALAFGLLTVRAAIHELIRRGGRRE